MVNNIGMKRALTFIYATFSPVQSHGPNIPNYRARHERQACKQESMVLDGESSAWQ
jgi:hypothetical protein